MQGGDKKHSKEVIVGDDCFNGRPVWSGNKSIFHKGSKWHIGHVDKSHTDYISTTNLAKCPQNVGDSWAAVGQFTTKNGWNVYNVSCAGNRKPLRKIFTSFSKYKKKNQM